MKPTTGGDDIDLGISESNPKWNGRWIQRMDDEHLIRVLRFLQRLAEVKRRAEYGAYAAALEDAEPSMVQELKAWKNEVRDRRTWRDYVDQPTFEDLEAEAGRRLLLWNAGIKMEEEIDLSRYRGELEREVVGAIRDAVNAHGPITRDNANSVGKRVIGAIKSFNRRVRHGS